jgi:hypothetical protein
MIITVIVWRITTSFNAPYAGAGYVVGNFIHTLFNDSTLAVTVEIRDSATPGAGTLINTPATGPNLFFVDGGIAQRLTPDPLYSYCDGTTLKSIQHKNTFPYGELGDTLNAVECQIAPVCDLQISDSYTVVDATGPGEPDGSIQVSGTSSNGEIRYSLTELFDYATASPSGLFTGLVSGDYTVYGRDAIGCTDSISINVPITIVYGSKYRLEYDDIRQGKTRVDILQRSYADTIIEVNGGPVPFSLRYNKDVNNKYDQISYSEATIQLLTEVSEQFIELFQGDDRKYQIRFYKFESDWVLKWIGYVVAEFYQEALKFEPFITTITASDNLKVVSEANFYDENGNQIRDISNIITVITRLLKQTALLINLRCCVDIYENSMLSTADDDSLAQTFFDPTIFYATDKTPDKIVDVIQKLLLPFGARIFQSLGVWWIVRIEQSVGTLNYREFDFNGVFVESGTLNPVVDLLSPRFDLVHWINDDQLMQLMQHYGEFTISQNLALDNNLLDSGNFEQEFLTSTGGGSFFFEGWNILATNPGVKYGLEQVDNGNSKGAFYIDYDLVVGGPTAGDDQLYTKKIRVNNASKLTIRFQTLVEPTYNLPFIRIGYRVKCVSIDLSQTFYLLVINGVGSLLDDSNGVDDWNNSGYINEIYVTSYGRFQDNEFSFLVPFDNSGGWDLEFNFYFNPYFSLNGTDFSELQAIDTTSRLQGIRRKYYSDQSDLANPITYDMLLSPSPPTESESIPDIVEPHDYGVGNQSRWKKQNAIAGAFPRKINKILIDNFTISEKIYVNHDASTGLITPPNIVEYNSVTNIYNFNKFSTPAFLGDLPTDDNIQNAALIYDGFFRLADGTPTTSWHRLSEIDERFLLEILLSDVQAQMQAPNRKITGGVMSPTHLGYIHSIDYAFEDRKYMINGYVLNDKQCSYEMDLIEIITGEDGNPPPETHEFTEEFTTEYDA